MSAALIAGAGFLALVLASSGSTAGKRSKSPATGRCGAEWPGRLAVLRPHMERLEVEAAWPGLADFLTVVAYQESCGRLDLSHDGGIGRGPFALHASTSTVQAIGGKSALALLEDPRIAVATAATHAWRLTRGPYQYPRGDTRWTDIRAGWAIPSWTGNRNAPLFVDSKGNTKTRAAVVERHLERAEALGVGAVIVGPAIPEDGYEWPGLAWALETLGIEVEIDADSPAA